MSRTTATSTATYTLDLHDTLNESPTRSRGGRRSLRLEQHRQLVDRGGGDGQGRLNPVRLQPEQRPSRRDRCAQATTFLSYRDSARTHFSGLGTDQHSTRSSTTCNKCSTVGRGLQVQARPCNDPPSAYRGHIDHDHRSIPVHGRDNLDADEMLASETDPEGDLTTLSVVRRLRPAARVRHPARERDPQHHHEPLSLQLRHGRQPGPGGRPTRATSLTSPLPASHATPARRSRRP